jgi:hypothetical protein
MAGTQSNVKISRERQTGDRGVASIKPCVPRCSIEPVELATNVASNYGFILNGV